MGGRKRESAGLNLVGFLTGLLCTRRVEEGDPEGAECEEGYVVLDEEAHEARGGGRPAECVENGVEFVVLHLAIPEIVVTKVPK